MLITKCMMYICAMYCQDLVADLNGGYKYTEPYVSFIDKQCLKDLDKK